MTVVIQARDLSRWYGQVIGVNDITVEVPPGITGLVGPNGAGKSTLLRMLVGELRPSRGTIAVLDQSPFANREFFRSIGFVPQQDALYDSMTARAMVSFLMRLHGFGADEADDRACTALKRVGLAADQDRRVGGYSKGMRQRVRIAQAIAHEPRLIVLDEPLAGLDPVGRREILDLMREMGAGGTSLVVSSHVLHELEHLTDRILLLHRGRLIAQGSVLEIRRLLGRHPSKVTIWVERARELAAALIQWPEVRSVRVQMPAAGSSTERLSLETNALDAFRRRFTSLAADCGFGVERFECIDDGLEAVFDYLVG